MKDDERQDGKWRIFVPKYYNISDPQHSPPYPTSVTRNFASAPKYPNRCFLHFDFISYRESGACIFQPTFLSGTVACVLKIWKASARDLDCISIHTIPDGIVQSEALSFHRPYFNIKRTVSRELQSLASSLNIIFEWMQILFDEGSSIPILSKKKWKRKSKERTSHRNRSLRDVGNLVSRLWVFTQIQDEIGSNKRLSTSTYYNYDRIPIIYQLFTEQQAYVIKV